MSRLFEQIKNDIIDALKMASKTRTSSYDTTAEVLHVDGDTAWVKIPGGVEETPVEHAINASPGDIVQVRVGNGRAWITGNNTAPPTDDTTAIYARTVAVETQENLEELEEYFWHDGQGAHVLGNVSGYRNDIKSDGMHIVQTSTDEEVAKFAADGSQIGKDAEGHIVIDFHSMAMYNRNGTAVFEVKDERDAEGYVQLSETFEGDGSTKNFQAKYPISTIISVTVDGTTLPASDYTISGQTTLRFQNAPSEGAVIVLDYKTNAAIVAFTFGRRAAGSEVGMTSVAEGINVEASGVYSHAEGYATKASGRDSHAEGSYTQAVGNFSHAEGTYTEANGAYSHAQNFYTIANGSAQTSMGMFNVPDNNWVYSLMIGNGTDSNTRSNALGVTWKGDIEFDIKRNAHSSSIDGALMAALTAKGWGGGAIVGTAQVGTATLGTAISGEGGLNSLKVLLTKIINAL